MKKRWEERLRRSFFVRFHMTMILAATVLTGVLCAKGMLALGVRSMAIRYGVAVAVSYAGFFLFVKLWLLYVASAGLVVAAKPRKRASGGTPDLVDLSDLPDIGSGGGKPFGGFGGGSSGGGGAGGSFVEGGIAEAGSPVSVPVESSGGGGGGSGGVLDALDVPDLGDEGFGILAILLLSALVLSIAIGGVYLVWCAPSILAEAAFQGILVAGFSKRIREAKESGWQVGILKSTGWIFALVLAFSVAFGAVAQKYCPSAVTMKDLLHGTGFRELIRGLLS